MATSVQFGKSCTSEFLKDDQIWARPKEEGNLKSSRSSRVPASVRFSKLDEKSYTII